MEVKQFGPDSAEAANTRRLINKRLEDIKNPYRAVTVEFADLHDRPERMAIKKAVQVKDFLDSFIDSFLAARDLVDREPQALPRAVRLGDRQGPPC